MNSKESQPTPLLVNLDETNMRKSREKHQNLPFKAKHDLKTTVLSAVAAFNVYIG